MPEKTCVFLSVAMARAMLAAHLLSFDLLPFCHKRHDAVGHNVAVAKYLEGNQK
jgi:hypothetical protein